MISFILITLLIGACIYHAVRMHQLSEEQELELSAARRKHHDMGFSKGWAQCHQAMSLRMENTEELRLQARRSQLAMEAANARLKYFDEIGLKNDASRHCSCRNRNWVEFTNGKESIRITEDSDESEYQAAAKMLLESARAERREREEQVQIMQKQ